MPPNTDVNLSTCSDATFELVSGRFPTTDAALLLIQPQDFWKQFIDSSQVTDVNLSTCSDATSWKQLTGFLPTTDVNLPTCSDFSQPLKLVYGSFPTTDAALLLIQPQDFWKQFTGSPSKRMLTYHLFRFNLKISENSSWILPNRGCQPIACSDPQFRNGLKLGRFPNVPFQMASLSPSPTSFCHSPRWHR